VISHYLSEQIQNPKVAATVAVATPSAAGVSSALGIIPPHVTFFSVCIGIVLSTVLIIVHIRKEMRESREWKIKAEINAMSLENEKLENAILKSKCNIMEEIDRVIEAKQ
jgi:hypothetical protein